MRVEQYVSAPQKVDIVKIARFLRKHSNRGFGSLRLGNLLNYSDYYIELLSPSLLYYYPEISKKPWGRRSLYRWMNPTVIDGHLSSSKHPVRPIQGRVPILPVPTAEEIVSEFDLAHVPEGVKDSLLCAYRAWITAKYRLGTHGYSFDVYYETYECVAVLMQEFIDPLWI